MSSPDSNIPLYSATYSSVPVYEFLTPNGGSIMRRKSDDWVNATHILKAADFAKAKRTRILEREVQCGEHEKVQGGYGKYQGTWIPLTEAQELAKRFDVYNMLSPILHKIDFDPPLVPKISKASKNKDASLTPVDSSSKSGSVKLKKKSEKAPKAAKSLSLPSNNNSLNQESISKKSIGRSASVATRLPSITDSVLEKPLVTKITISKESQNSMTELQTRKRGRPRRSESAPRNQERKQSQILPAAKDKHSNSGSPTLTSSALLHKILPKSGRSQAKSLKKYQSTPILMTNSPGLSHDDAVDVNALRSQSMYEDDADTATDDDIENDIDVNSDLAVIPAFNEEKNNVETNMYYEDEEELNAASITRHDSSNISRNYYIENPNADIEEEIQEPPKKKKRGRKPKHDPSLTLATPVKNNKTTMEYNVLKSFANEKSSPLNERELSNYLRQNNKNISNNSVPGVANDLSRIEEEEEISRMGHHETIDGPPKGNFKSNSNGNANSNSNGNRFKTFDPSSSPSVFMSEHDLAKALKSPTSRRGTDQIQDEAEMKTGVKSINSFQQQPDIGNTNGDTSNAATPAERAGGLSTTADSEWFDDSDEFTKRLVTYLMRSGSREDNHYFTKMSGASDSHNEGVPEFLLHLPTNFHINKHIDPDGNTALHWACALGRLPIIEFLLKKCGADSKCVNNKGLNPLMRTVKYNNSYTNRIFSKTVDLLKDSIFETDSKKRSVLHHIALSSNSPSKSNSSRYYTEILLSKVFDLYDEAKMKNFVNLQDNKGNTAIYYAISNNAKKCVKVLLGHHAILNIKNNRGETSIDLLDRNAILLGNSTASTASTPMTNKSLGYTNPYYSGSQGGETSSSGSHHHHNNMNAFTPQMKPMRAGPSRRSLSFTPPVADLNLPQGLSGSSINQKELACNSENKKLVETTENSLMKSFNEAVNIYNEEIIKKNKLIESLKNSKAELVDKINLIEKNIVSSSMVVSQNGTSQLASDDIEADEAANGENTTSLASSIIKKGNSQLSKKASKQLEILNAKIQQFEDLLRLIQKVNLSKIEKEKKHETAVEATNKQDTPNALKDEKLAKVGYCIEICKLQCLRDYKTKQILSYFISDQNGNILDQLEKDWKITQEKIKRMNLYRRLVAACCDIGINEVDDLIDVIYKSLVKSEN